MVKKTNESKLRELQELEFVAIDLNLYLDTHPDDDEAIKKLNEHYEKLKTLRETYESEVTMLFSHHIKNEKDLDQWINDPWPWEKQ